MVGAKDDIGLPFGKTSVNLRCDCPRVDIACMGNYSPQSRKLLRGHAFKELVQLELKILGI
jgi:hypothetical protein